MMRLGDWLVLAILVAVSRIGNASRAAARVCQTPECLEAAARFLNSMNTSADPCNDFNEYACGGWFAANPIPDDKPDVNQFGQLDDITFDALRGLLSSDSSNDRDAIRKVKTFYRSCMDEETIERLGAGPALDFVRDKLRGMPLFGDRFVASRWDLESYLARTKNRVSGMFRSTSAPLISMYVKPDDKNSSKHILILDQPRLGMPGASYYIDDAFNASLTAYRQYMEDFLGELWKSKLQDRRGGPRSYNEEKLKRAVAEIIQLETDLAKIFESGPSRYDILLRYGKYSLREMRRQISPRFDWRKFINRALRRAGVWLNAKNEVVSYATNYFRKLMPVLAKYKNRVVKNYLVWMGLNAHVGFLSKKFRDTQAAFRQATRGTTEEEVRHKTCIKTAIALMPMPVGALYVKHKFAKSSKREIDTMTGNIIKAFKDDLPSIAWMDEVTRNAALVKIANTDSVIGYPDYIIDEQNLRLDEEYSDAYVADGKYFESVWSLYRLQMTTNLMKLRRPVDRLAWKMSPARINAYNSPENVMGYPAAFLQSPFYDPNRPFAMNYGAVGSIIGHEVIHGFDSRGSRYDAYGNVAKWWSDYSLEHFETAAQCVRDLYSGFFYEPAGMYVNGNQTVSENTADLAGLRLAYTAYQTWARENPGREFKLPGLERFTEEQLLFIARSQTMCHKEKPAQAKRRIMTSHHSPGEFRLKGAVMNFDEFGKAFGCRRGEDALYPNPEDTCRVW